MISIIKVFRDRNFSLFFLADFLSSIGSGMTIIGVNWYIFEQTKSAILVSNYLLIHILASLISSPLIGVIIDRMNKKSLLVKLNFARGMSFILIFALLYSLDGFNIYLMYLLALFSGIGWAGNTTAVKTFVRSQSDDSLFVTNNSILEMSMSVGFFLASGMYGVMYQYISFKGVILLDIATFFLAALLLTFLNAVKMKDDKTEKESFITEFKEGLSYMSKMKKEFLFGICMFIPVGVMVASNIVLPAYVSDFLGESSIVFGIGDMGFGIGAFVAGLIAGYVASKLTKIGSIGWSGAILVISLSALYINSSVWGLYALYFIFGVSSVLLRIVSNSFIMEKIESKLFGRSISTWQLFGYFFQMTVIVVIGNLLEIYNPNFGYLILGIISLISLVLLFGTAMVIGENTESKEEYSAQVIAKEEV